MKVVTRDEFASCLEHLKTLSKLSLDTETFGLRVYQGDRLFSIIIGSSPTTAFYFNFQAYDGLTPNFILPSAWLRQFESLFSDEGKTWFIHNAKFDMGVLQNEGLFIKGRIHCTLALGRIVYNEHLSYSLDDSLIRLGLEKDAGPEKWIEENEAWEWIEIPDKKTRVKNKFYYKVPWDIIVPYGLKDATGTFALGLFQESEIEKQSNEDIKNVPKVSLVAGNEMDLIKTVFKMESHGALIDIPFCREAVQFERENLVKAGEEFKKLTGLSFKASPLIYRKVFASEESKWKYKPKTKTGKINPTFEGDILKTFDNPAVSSILKIRDAKAKLDFYSGFLYHADANSFVHPNFNASGTVHGRFSSSEPNFQNLKNDDDTPKEEHFVVRRAIIPPPGYIICSIDYSAMEYRFMLEYACAGIAGRETDLARKINAGMDFHQATADVVKEKTGVEITRAQAKTSNFLTLYGGGNQKLADGLKIPLETARTIREGIKKSAPEIDAFIQKLLRTANERDYIRNWLGRRCYFPNKNFAYIAPNYLIAGGCADITKVAMNRIDAYLKDLKSKMFLTIHDELVFYIHETETDIIPYLKSFMEKAYPSEYVPLKCQAYVSDKSLADIEPYEA